MEDYREFRIQHGQYAGSHRIYWNADICKRYEKIDIVKRWAIDNDMIAGDWIESLDGSCCQLFGKRTHIDKKKRPHTFYRFPMCTITSYITMKGVLRWNNFYASLAARNRDFPYRRGENGYHQKIRFISYIISGINPLKAYRLAFNYYTTISIASLHRRITTILLDKDIQMELKDQLQPFTDKLESKLSEDDLISELTLLIKSSKKGSKDHRENLQFILEILGKLPNKSVKSLKEITYQEVQPPMLLDSKKESATDTAALPI